MNNFHQDLYHRVIGFLSTLCALGVTKTHLWSINVWSHVILDDVWRLAKLGGVDP